MANFTVMTHTTICRLNSTYTILRFSVIIYRYNIDCQWIDMTDLTAGNYLFRVGITGWLQAYCFETCFLHTCSKRIKYYTPATLRRKSGIDAKRQILALVQRCGVNHDTYIAVEVRGNDFAGGDRNPLRFAYQKHSIACVVKIYVKCPLTAILSLETSTTFCCLATC